MVKKVCVLAGCACSVSAVGAQTELGIEFYLNHAGRWNIIAELYNPTGTVLATIADLGFSFTGTGISNVEYNPSFDSDFFGPADLAVTSTSLEFSGGNTLPPLDNAGGVDSSNPLHIMSFDATSLNIVDFELIGQVTGAYVNSPFPQIITYQRADGSADDTPWFAFFPSPGVVPAFMLYGAACARRRR